MLNTNEWFTPPHIVDLVKEVLGQIDLDPATSIVANDLYLKAKRIYTKETDGLIPKWTGKVFLNPPYSARLIKRFLNKADYHFQNGDVEEMIILTNSGTDTLWNQIISKHVQAYTFGRLSFISAIDLKPAGKTSRGQCATYLGNNPQKFIKIFTKDKLFWIPNINLLA